MTDITSISQPTEPQEAKAAAVDPLIAEERKRTSQAQDSLKKFLSDYSSEHEPEELDLLDGTYRIHMKKPLPEYDGEYAKAFEAENIVDAEVKCFAIICDPGKVQRFQALKQIREFDHRAILHILGAGSVDLSEINAQRYVIIYQRPVGQRLSDLVKNKKLRKSPHYILEHIMIPLLTGLEVFYEADLSHGCLNPDNIFYDGTTAVMGPCVSGPCGHSQPFYYESPERMQAHHCAKGEGSVAQDYYALAVVLLYIFHGEEHFKPFTQEKLIHLILREGAYHTLLREREVPEIFYDFLRGSLTQSPEDRWSQKQMSMWLGGKRFNVLPPPPPNEAIRPFEFMGVQVNNRRELAHLFSKNWAGMLEALETSNLGHWAVVSLRDKELSEQLARFCKSLDDVKGKNENQVSEILMNIVLLLDQIGPIRIRDISMHVDGIETMVAELYKAEAKAELQFMAKFVETKTLNYWISLQTKRVTDFHISDRLNKLTHKLDRLRNCIRNSGYGFGMERMLYDLNPDMACQSPLLEKRYVNTLPKLLKQLDRIAHSISDDVIVDQHISAFITSKLQIQHEIRLQKLSGIPALANNKSMISLHLLSIVQERIEPVRVPGLTHWFAIRLLPLLDSVHSRTLRQRIKNLLVNAAPVGLLQKIAQMLIAADYATADANGFEKAVASYRKNAHEIHMLNTPERLESETERMGLNLATVLAISGMVFSTYYLITELAL